MGEGLSKTQAYIGSVPLDLFRDAETIDDRVINYLDQASYYSSGRYANDRPSVNGLDIRYFTQSANQWLLMSLGPSRGLPDFSDGLDGRDSYDPTNGLRSLGLIMQPGP